MSAKVIPNSERWFDLTDLPKEEWRDIEGYEGSYQISNYGRVKSLAREPAIGLRKENYKDHILTASWSKPKEFNRDGTHAGYLTSTLTSRNKSKPTKLHQLVARAFIPNPENLPQINHKSEDKTDSSVWNLEWCNEQYNSRYGTRMARISSALKNREDTSKRVGQYSMVGEFIKVWSSMNEVERETGIHLYPEACNGTSIYSHGHQWRFLDENGNPTTPLVKEIIHNSTGYTKRVGQFDLDGNLIKIWNNIGDIDSSHISHACLGKAKTANGYQWRFLDENDQPLRPLLNGVKLDRGYKKRVAQYSLDGRLVKIYNSALDAEYQSGNKFNHSNISHCCKDGYGRKSYKGFKWRYLDENDNPTIPLLQ